MRRSRKIFRGGEGGGPRDINVCQRWEGGLKPIFGTFTVRKFIKFPGGGGPDLDPLPPKSRSAH